MLSDHDFELLAASLLDAERGGRWEVFARGADGGVDVRRLVNGKREIVQCKHMLKSSKSKLLTAAKKEKKNVDKLKPASYQFWTTQSLTAENKADIAEILSPWIKSDSDVWGEEDLELALDRHPNVERGHVKLWIAGAGQLSAQVNGGVWQRSKELAQEIERALPRYVETGIFTHARDILESNRVLIISGSPGVGKTTIARLLVANLVDAGYEPVSISGDVDEGQSVIDTSKKQVFLYDDFLGSNFLSNRLSKNEDKRLASFIRACRHSENTLFIMTTREYILQQALSDYEELERVDLDVERLVVKLEKYSRVEKARILYNHLFHSNHLQPDALAQLRAGKAYLRVIDHRNYNPRLIEFATLTDPTLRGKVPENYADYILGLLDDPKSVWSGPFSKQIDSAGQTLVILIACLDGLVSEDEAYAMISAACDAGLCDRVKVGALKDMLKVLDDSFLSTTRAGATDSELLIGLANPSVGDFVTGVLANDRTRRNSVIESFTHFEQAAWILKGLRASIPPEEHLEFDALISDAFSRLFQTPLPRSSRPPTAGFRPRRHEVQTDPVERLTVMHQAMELSATIFERLTDHFDQQLQATFLAWQNGSEHGDFAMCSDVVQLVRRVRRSNLPPEAWRSACELVGDLYPSVEKWELLEKLNDLTDPDEDLLGPHVSEFQEWLGEVLGSGSDEMTVRELDEARAYADHLGVSVDEEQFDAMQTEAALREDELSEVRYEEYRDSRGPRDDDYVAAIFERSTPGV
ncbi:hypothetical protein GCM10009710_33630 [Aeromicrobium alkaliterrae]|uniref:Novel STAND NTPase 3 domain-containing protein n=2 Tax=Aeromicrobium alkaliterrae TaxID=302168 RepID=A0ABP4WC22_9ACTN